MYRTARCLFLEPCQPPTRTAPRKGSAAAKMTACWGGERSLAPVPTVVTVKIAGVPGLTELGLIEHCGASCGVGETEQVRATELLKPPAAVTLMVEEDVCPGLTVPGESADAETAKSGVISKVAVMDVLVLIVMLHAPVPEHPPPDQPEKVEPVLALAVRVRFAPLA